MGHTHKSQIRVQAIDTFWQQGSKCVSLRAGLIDSENPNHVLFCRDLRAFSGVIFPYFDGNSNIFARFIEQKSYQ